MIYLNAYKEALEYQIKHYSRGVEKEVLEIITMDIVKAMSKSKVNPKYIYAFCKTGRLVTSENKKLLGNADLQEFYNAINEFSEKYLKG